MFHSYINGNILIYKTEHVRSDIFFNLLSKVKAVCTLFSLTHERERERERERGREIGSIFRTVALYVDLRELNTKEKVILAVYIVKVFIIIIIILLLLILYYYYYYYYYYLLTSYNFTSFL